MLTLNHAQLAIPPGGEAQARQFYAGLLGFTELPKPPELASRGGVWFQVGNSEIHLGVEQAFRPAKKAHVAFTCSDYASLLDLLASNGIQILSDPLLFNGAEHCYIADPFGNRIELINGTLH